MDHDSIALDTARKIEDLFAQHHPGGRGQRLAKIQVLVREAIATGGSYATSQSSAEARDVRSREGQVDNWHSKEGGPGVRGF
jgi:hypothetical protein